VRELVAPTARLEAAWREAHEEWGPGSHEDGFGLAPDDDVQSANGFVCWLDRLAQQSDPGIRPPTGKVHCTYRWVVDDDQVLGGIALRHELNAFNSHLGHVGYGIRPSARRGGLATWALGRMLVEARYLGLDRLLLVCAGDNVASAKMIEHHGGALEGDIAGEVGELRRYWIAVRSPADVARFGT
jgi:predicted acetyltransferase